MQKKIPIWGERIPFNSSKSKLEDMNYSPRGKYGIIQMMKFVQAIKGAKYKDTERAIDTFTYCAEIKSGHEKETYEDVPYLVPFVVEGSRRAVIIVPGGGYAYKSSHVDPEGKQGEGDAFAKKLNEAGISAFVLSYRSNPYVMPTPLLDVQRSIRYVKYHADEYGLDAEQIVLAGFSAGGFQVGGAINILRDLPVQAEGYTEDEIDKVSAKVMAAGLIYPCINFKYNVPMLFSAFPAEQVRDTKTREKLLEEYDNITKVQENDPPQFICYGTKDSLVNPIQSKQYVRALEEKRVPVKCLEVEGANHGYGANMKKYAFWMDEFIGWLRQIK